jgi:hypothetical protein
MLHHLVQHATVHALKTKGEESKAGGIALIVIGFFLTPILIGIPIMIVGVIKVINSSR